MFDGYVEGIAITPDYPVVLPVDIAIGVPSPITPENRLEMARACRERFEAFMTTKQISRSVAGVPGLSFGWRQDGLMEDAFSAPMEGSSISRSSGGPTGHERPDAPLHGRSGPFRDGTPSSDRSTRADPDLRRHRRHRLEPEHGNGAGRSGIDAAADKKASAVVVLELDDLGRARALRVGARPAPAMHDLPAEAVMAQRPIEPARRRPS